MPPNTPASPIELPVNPEWELHPRGLQERLKAGEKILLLDVRQLREWETARLAGALLIPLNELPDRAAELAPFREQPIAVLCHHGVRSLRATAYLRSLGFLEVDSIAGGIEAWSVLVDPSVPRY